MRGFEAPGYLKIPLLQYNLKDRRRKRGNATGRSIGALSDQIE
jgi:hypothetical protein